MRVCGNPPQLAQCSKRLRASGTSAPHPQSLRVLHLLALPDAHRQVVAVLHCAHHAARFVLVPPQDLSLNVSHHPGGAVFTPCAFEPFAQRRALQTLMLDATCKGAAASIGAHLAGSLNILILEVGQPPPHPTLLYCCAPGSSSFPPWHHGCPRAAHLCTPCCTRHVDTLCAWPLLCALASPESVGPCSPPSPSLLRADNAMLQEGHSTFSTCRLESWTTTH